MASINSLMSSSSSSSSIYGNSNIISGLATGMDTEAMIENAVSGIKNKIAGFNQDKTMLEWEQTAYRSIIDKMVNFSNKYMSFSSNTNLLSSAFFDSAMKVTTSGKNAGLISAVGAPTSNVRITAVRQLAKAATYNPTTALNGGSGLTGSALETYSSAVEGSMTLSYGGKDYTIKFDEGEVYKSKSALVDAINKKLKDEGVEGVEVAKTDDGTGIQFKTTDDAELKITAAEGALTETLGIAAGEEDVNGKAYSFGTGALYNTQINKQSLIGKEFSFTLDGETRKITLSEEDLAGVSNASGLAGALRGKLATAFGDGKVNVTANGGKLSFAANAGSTLKIEGGESLGLSASATSGVDMTKKLSELGFAAGDNGYSFTMNGKTLTFGKDATLNDVVNTVNKDSDIGVKISYSQMTGKFQLTSKATGTAGRIEIKEGDLAAQLFGTTDVTGTDALVDMEVNGEPLTGVTRSSNTFDVDGMTVTLNGTFTDGEAVSFTSATDTDKIVDAIKSLVEDFNTMANEIKDAYTTKPLTQSNGKKYKPLTEEDSKDMSDDAIKKYEEKAKTGLLFADSNLSGLYSELRSAISDIDLEAIGIKTAYAGGKTTLVLDEDKLRATLESDPDKVKETLTRSKENGDSKDGMMVSLQNTIDKYAKTTGATKGILIELAGSERAVASLSKNNYKDKMDRLQEQIERWQEKLSDKVDYYTRQFTALEKLVSEMNSQSSALAGMMGY